MPSLGIGVTLPRQLYGSKYQEFTWAQAWASSVGTNEGSGTGQQYRGLRVDGSGRVWAAGGLITYNGAAAAEEYISTDALTTPAPDGPSGQKVNYIAVAHRASDGVHQIATAIGNTNNYARCYAVTHDTVNGLTYIAGRAGEHMETTAGAYQTTFQGDGNPNTLYGPQDPYIAAIDTATGEIVYASYFGVAASGDFFRDIIYHDGYIYAGQARYAPSGTTRGVRLLKIEPDLSDIVDTWDFDNPGNSDGQPALVARGNYLWCYLITTVAIGNGAPTSGAILETFGSGSHSRSYIAKFDISGSTFSFVQSTYIRTLTGTSPLVGATHTIDWIPRDGGSIILSLGGADSTCDFPTYGTPQFESAAGAGGNAYFLQIPDSLEGTPHYGTYLHTDTVSERVANSSIRASRDGKRALMPFEVNSTTWPTTDGSTNAGGLNVGMSIIFRIPEDGVGWEVEHLGYYSAESAFYASEFDAAGNAYVAGYLTNSANPVPIVQRLTPTLVVPPTPITAPTIETAVVDGITGSASTSRTITIPSSVTTGDWLLIAAVHRQDGTLSSSIGTQVGSQASDFANHEMAVWKYQVTGSDVPGTTTFTVSSTSAFTALSICLVPVTGSGGVDDEAGPGSYGAFGNTVTAPSTTSTQANSVAVCFVSANTSATYTPQSGAVEIAEATTGTAGLYAFSYLQEAAGVVGTLTATIDGGGSSNHYGCTILMQGT